MVSLVETLKKKYGVSHVYRYAGYADDSRERNFVVAIENAAVRNHLIPSYLFTIVIGEGFGFWIDINYGPHHINLGNHVDGFDSLGLDHFDSDFFRIKRFLPKDYNRGDEFTGHTAMNEQYHTVQTAGFKNAIAGIQGVSATLAHRKTRFLKNSEDLGYIKKYGQPTEDQLAFWLYVYYQGEGRARKYLQSNAGYMYTTPPPVNMTQIKRLALERVASWRYVQSKKLFSR